MLRSCRAFQACIRVFDDEPGFQPRDFAGQACELHRIEHGVEILVGGGRLVLRIQAAVCEDVVRSELVVHGFLINSAVGGFGKRQASLAVLVN